MDAVKCDERHDGKAQVGSVRTVAPDKASGGGKNSTAIAVKDEAK